MSEELEYRLDVCRATNGSHIELHWTDTKLGKFPFHLVKISHFYLVSFISCGPSKVHGDFTDTLFNKWNYLLFFFFKARFIRNLKSIESKLCNNTLNILFITENKLENYFMFGKQRNNWHLETTRSLISLKQYTV